MSDEKEAPTEVGVEKKQARTQMGVVISDKCSKTRVVRVDWSTRHPIYGKVMRRSTKYHVHDEENTSGLGDTVKIKSSRPMSKLKSWVLVDVVAKASTIGR
jgi:small subunit ribosomal protein S17